MAAITLTIDDQQVSAEDTQTVLSIARENAIDIPTLCHLEGLYDIGACRICLVEVVGINKLLPACTTKASESMVVKTDTERLRKYRKMTLELLFAERNHTCAVCVSNGQCELQTLAYNQGMDHVRYKYQFPAWDADLTHKLFGMDHNRCILCSRCVRTCWHIEGAATKNIAGRGSGSHIITDMSQPWGDSDSCTKCGKCVMSCPTGALFYQGSTASEMKHDREKLEYIVTAREKKQWIV